VSLNHYGVFGLSVASEIPLPELRRRPSQTSSDVFVRRGEVPPSEGAQIGLSVDGDKALLLIPEVGRYLMIAGQELIVDPWWPEVSERNIRLYLLGSAFGAILHQRDLLPLHANSIIVDGRAIGFMGHPGAGKSTMAAQFHDSGFPILGDDVCVVSGGAKPVAHAGIPRLRLWREALEASGRTVEGYEMSFDDYDKYNVPIGDDSGTPEQAPLSHLYLLDDAGGSGSSAIEPLHGAAALEALVANTYRGSYVQIMGRTEQHLRACIQLAQVVPVFRVCREWGLQGIADQASSVAAHARSMIAAG
jgi:hypothetical protein